MTVNFTINGRPQQAPEGTLLIEACRRAGIAIPRFCYHPGLSVVGSCRMCLVELEGKAGGGKLIPSCQTHVAEGVNVLTDTARVQANRRGVMEYLLINHPLDCPVCDQAGECYLQDYSFNHGRAATRFAEAKIKQSKKDVGRNIVLYMDRCVLCSRCVRFTREIAGTGELTVVGRGNRCEIDIFPGRPLDNKLSGCVADICPVGALLDKKFLHRQRAWLLSATPSICPRCSAGCNINIFHNQGQVWRLKPRENRDVNGFWMCDDGRYGWDHVHDPRRLNHRPRVREQATPGQSPPGDQSPRPSVRGLAWQEMSPDMIADRITVRLSEAVHTHGPGSVAAVLSPMWTTEEQFLLARVVRQIDAEALLAVGPVPAVGQDERFKAGFTIRAEKCPNRRGAERVLAALGGPRASFDELLTQVGGRVHAVWLNGGYPPDIAWHGENANGDPSRERELAGTGGQAASGTQPGDWLSLVHAARLSKPDLLVIASDIFPTAAMAAAEIQWPGVSWAERTGTFVNADGRVQQLAAAPVGPENAQPIGELLWRMLGQVGPEESVELWRAMGQAGVEGYPPRPPADVLCSPSPFAGNRSAPGVHD